MTMTIDANLLEGFRIGFGLGFAAATILCLVLYWLAMRRRND